LSLWWGARLNMERKRIMAAESAKLLEKLRALHKKTAGTRKEKRNVIKKGQTRSKQREKS